ncbi:MAG: hypothetical protein VB138_00200 [Burkholderia sp.]
MNCKPGDLAYIVVPPGFLRTLDRKFVNVGIAGECDLGTLPVPGVQCWLCEFHVPWFCERTRSFVRRCWLRDDWLRPIRGGMLTDDVDAHIPEVA